MFQERYPTIWDEDVEVRTRTGVRLLTDMLFAAPATYEADNHAKYVSSYNISKPKYPSITGKQTSD